MRRTRWSGCRGRLIRRGLSYDPGATMFEARWVFIFLGAMALLAMAMPTARAAEIDGGATLAAPSIGLDGHRGDTWRLRPDE